MYESPINQAISKISSEIKECEDNQLMYKVRQTIGYDIDKTELVRALRYDREQYEKGYADGLNANRWIPVSERLPNLDDYNGSRAWQKTVLITGYFSFDDTKNLFISDAFAEDVVYNRVHDTVIIAWMPLPQPYKESKEV